MNKKLALIGALVATLFAGACAQTSNMSPTTERVPEPIYISKPYDAYESAASHLGLHERHDRRELMRLFGGTIGHLDPARTPWCAGFVDAMLVEAGEPALGSLRARDFASYGRAVSRPSKGDLVVLSRGSGGHVGFFHDYKYMNGARWVGVLGGNVGDGEVDLAYFRVSRVIGYRTY